MQEMTPGMESQMQSLHRPKPNYDEFPGGVGRDLLESGSLVEVPTWQALDVKDKPQGRTWEVLNRAFSIEIPERSGTLADICKPNLPWAESQFQERVGGEPVNPGDTYQDWPYYKGNVEQHKEQGQFSHTYMERYWPKRANGGYDPDDLGPEDHQGIRGQYGDLNDVINLLSREPTTRQAYLPVFFPEDTGAVHGERIPCSLGYLFMMREGKLNITYYIRSCDFYRHFRDDVYMTARLCQWVLQRCKGKELDKKYENRFWKDVWLGRLTMHIGSLHVFEGDLPKLRREYGS